MKKIRQNMRMNIALFLGFALLLPCSAIANGKIVNYSASPVTLNSQVTARGPKSIVNELYKSDATWAYLMKQISTGEKAWLEVAVSLRPGSDAGTTSMLEEAVSFALLNNPENVLRFAFPTYKLPNVCGGRADPLSTYELSMSEIKRQIKSVQSVKDAQLVSLRDICLAELEASKVHLNSFFGSK